MWVGAEAVIIRSILRALHGHCITELPRGWTALERTACHLRHSPIPACNPKQLCYHACIAYETVPWSHSIILLCNKQGWQGSIVDLWPLVVR